MKNGLLAWTKTYTSSDHFHLKSPNYHEIGNGREIKPGKNIKFLGVALQMSTICRTAIDILKFFLIFTLGLIFPYLIFALLIKNNTFFGLDIFLKFANEFEFNPIGYYLIKKFIKPDFGRVFILISWVSYFIFMYLFQRYRFQNFKYTISWIHNFFMIYLLFSPVVNPWYFLVLLPFYCINYSRLSFLWIIPFILQLAYITEINFPIPGHEYMGFYNIYEFITIIEIILVIIVIIFFLILR